MILRYMWNLGGKKKTHRYREQIGAAREGGWDVSKMYNLPVIK